MRTFGNAAYLLVAATCVGIAAYQPFDASTDDSSTARLGRAAPSEHAISIETVQPSIDRAIRFSPGLKV